MPKIPFAPFFAALLISLFCLNAHADDPASKINLQVHTASENSLYVNCTLIMGEKDMVLIDVPFTFSDAHRLVADILETGKNLTTIYVSHDHPDHFWGMQVVMDAFPQARVVSHPQVVKDIWRSIPFKITRWSGLLGSNGPSYPTAPQALEHNYLELEGTRLDILGPMQGDHAHATAVHIPATGDLIAGDLAFNGIHVWLGEADAKARKQWIKNLDDLAALKPKRVIAGHKLPRLESSVDSLRFTQDYIRTFSKEAAKAKTSQQLIARMQQLYPDVEDVLNDFILPNSAQVGVGEVAPWQE